MDPASLRRLSNRALVMDLERHKDRWNGLPFEILLALLGAVVLAIDVPWELLISNTIPAGGDNPSHPVLMQSLSEALFSHFAIVHYSCRFWGGFEMFQFYFPLPYLAAAVLSKFMGGNVAFKLVSIAGLIAFPPAFYMLSRKLGVTKTVSALASLLSLSFLFTDAHVMWGGNVYSAYAGMIGNSWAFPFFLMAFGCLYTARSTHSFSAPALAFSVLAIMSHFFGLFMLFVLYCIFLCEDAFLLIRTPSRQFRRGTISSFIPFHATGLATVVLMSWWIIPLFYYQPYSSGLGGNWNISLLNTFTFTEKIFFALALLIGVVQIVRSRLHASAMRFMLIYLGVFIICFLSNDWLKSAAFVNIRLWPTIYLSLYLILVLAADYLFRSLPLLFFCPVAIAFFFILPGERSFEHSRQLMQWNFSGLESKEGWNDYSDMLKVLRSEPPSRVSFESDGSNNALLGSVRAFEMLPYLTEHEIVEGGIANSARHAGVGYTLQCLMSTTCAGWPQGSIMPEKDIPRAIDYMHALGVGYHIASRPENRRALEDTGAFDVLYNGRYFGLYRLKERSPMVEVFGPGVWAVSHDKPTNLLLSLPRFDRFRNTGAIFSFPDAAIPEGDMFKVMQPADFFDTLAEEWRTNRRVADRGWKDRTEQDLRYLNGFVFFLNGKAILSQESLKHADFAIADRGFDPDVLVMDYQQGESELAAPLMRSMPGKGEITVSGKGYSVWAGSKEIVSSSPEKPHFSQKVSLQFTETVFAGGKSPFAMLKFIPDSRQEDRYADLVTHDSTVGNGIPGGLIFEPADNMTSSCKTSLEKAFQKMVLHTNCPGKAHLIKYSYYPKWQADVPIYLGTNGFMMLVPQKETTVLLHKRKLVDWIAIVITWAGVLALVLCKLRGRRHPPYSNPYP